MTASILSASPRPEGMPLTEWTATTVFGVLWQTGIFGQDLIGVYPNRDAAEAAFRARQAKGHSGSKAEPGDQRINECIRPRQAITDGTRFIPIGSWFDQIAKDLEFDDTDDASNAGKIVYTFGDVPAQ